MIAVIDYGLGNLFSLTASLNHLGIPNQITRNPVEIKNSDGIILPGVGAFGDAVDQLTKLDLIDVLKEEAQSAKPFLGICLGMQLLFEKSYEYGEHIGLGLLPGKVCALKNDLIAPDTLVPHMGWNELLVQKEDRIMEQLPAGAYVYFVHSFYAKNCEEVLIASSDYEGITVPAVVGQRNIYGMQFHPEKSGIQGLALLKNFANICYNRSEELVLKKRGDL